MKSSKSSQGGLLQQWERDHVWHPFTQMAESTAEPPLIIESADGCWLVDCEGNRYLDGVSSMWCNVHGHRHPTLDAAVAEQLGKVAHSTLLGASNVPAIRLARKLVELAAPLSADRPDGRGLTRVFYSDDGATAVEVALKMAFQYWRQREDPRPEKTKFVSLGGAYHGDTLGDVSLGGVERFHRLFKPLLFPTYRAPSHYCYRCPLGLERSTCQIDCLAELVRILEAHHREIAAVVVEPLVQGAAGMITAPEGYLRGVRDATRRSDVLLIADEVAVGFGRTGTMFACEQEKVCPDFLCLAKGLSGGYLPIAATLTTEDVYGAFLGSYAEQKAFSHGHTYTGNPLGAAVALASLKVFEEERTLEQLPKKLALFKQKLAQMAVLRHVGHTRSRGLMAGIELVADKQTKAPYGVDQRMGARVCRAARDHGVLLRPLGDLIVLMPPLSIPPDLLEQLCDVARRAIVEVTESNAHAV
jgi:adenosylmethionine-8-amino-7-oxononanoate aminotransferase